MGKSKAGDDAVRVLGVQSQLRGSQRRQFYRLRQD